MDIVGYDALRKEQAEKRARGELMGIGICSFTEIVGAGPSKHFDILGIKMFDSAEIRVHPTGKAMARFGTKIQGQGHETTYAQIVAEELGIPASDVQVEEGDTDTAPYGLGTYASRSTPTAGAAAAHRGAQDPQQGRNDRRAPARVQRGRPRVGSRASSSSRALPSKAKTIQEMRVRGVHQHPQGMEAGLEAVHYYDPPNLTFPFGSYICVVDIDRGTGEVKVRRFVAVDDCGNIINPMIVDGQIHGGLAQGVGPALYEEISYDEDGNISGGSFLDYYVPTAIEMPELGDRQDGHAFAAPSVRRQGRRRVGHRRRAARDRERGGGRALASRRHAHRHPDHAREGVATPEGERRGRVAGLCSVGAGARSSPPPTLR